MMLRRLADAVREQNWFTVLVELALVIVGVFVGIQVSNWNDARLERRQEGVILERLISDFRRIESEALVSLSVTAERADKLVELSERLGPLTEPKNSLPRLIQLLDGIEGRAPRGGSATYEELLSTGRLSLLQSEGLRSALRHYASVNAATESADRLIWDVVINQAPQLMSMTALADASEYADGDLNAFESELVERITTLDLVGDIAMHIKAQEARFLWANMSLDSARSVLAELGQKAEGGPAPLFSQD